MSKKTQSIHGAHHNGPVLRSHPSPSSHEYHKSKFKAAITLSSTKFMVVCRGVVLVIFLFGEKKSDGSMEVVSMSILKRMGVCHVCMDPIGFLRISKPVHLDHTF